MSKLRSSFFLLLELLVFSVIFSSLYLSNIFWEENHVLALAINNVTSSTINANVGGTKANSTSSSSGSVNSQKQTNVSSQSEAGANSQSNSSGTGSANAGLDVNVTLSPITIIRSQVLGQASDTPPDVVSVHTNSDISAYVTALVQSDENIDRVVLRDDKVTIVYKEPIKLFGFIPHMVNASAEVTSNDQVSVHYPWYSFLAVTHAKDLKSQLQTRVNTELDANTTIGSGANATFSFQTQARLVSAMKDVLHTYFVSQTGASAKIENPRDTP